MSEVPAIGTHMAVLNLFREPDGSVEITVADARGAMVELQERGCTDRPIDYVEYYIVKAAEAMKARQKTVTFEHHDFMRGEWEFSARALEAKASDWSQMAESAASPWLKEYYETLASSHRQAAAVLRKGQYR